MNISNKNHYNPHILTKTKNYDSIWDAIIESDKRKAGESVEFDEDGNLVIHDSVNSSNMNMPQQANTDTFEKGGNNESNAISTANSMSETTENVSLMASKQALGSILKRVEMMQSDLYTGRSWGRLMKTYSSSKAVFLRESPDEKDINRALRSLMRDFMALQQAEIEEDPFRDKLPVVLKSDLPCEQVPVANVADMGGGDVSIDITV